ncbi:MAG: N-acetylmuramoyl-L-alanine amidase CwlD [Bacillota bacterium]|nr:MAG: N-acetylmuramoyl-L-alanine amidase CwlD [Bacillota bacterium]MBS3951186.1 N-acetylmuramoyl-L-alanine amidase CwlD [Peptococcaceae bacterium]
MRRLLICLLALAAMIAPMMILRHCQTRETLSVPLLYRIVAIDPGHGGVDPGALGHNGMHEKAIVLNIALKLRSLLQSSGAIVVMTRDTDTDLSEASLGNQYSRRKRQDLERRVELIDNSGAELLVSIHVNSIASGRWAGGQAFYSPGSDQGKLLAQSLQSALKEVLKNTNRQAATGDYYIMRESQTLASLVEVGFISNPQEGRLLAQDDYQNKVAWAIYVGILKHFAAQPSGS